MRLMVDINVFLDVILGRPGSETSAQVLSLHDRNGFDLVMPAHGAATILYLTAKARDRDAAVNALSLCLAVSRIGALDEKAVLRGLSYGFRDVEDAFVAAIAVDERCDLIVTGNVKDFSESPIPAITPTELLARVEGIG